MKGFENDIPIDYDQAKRLMRCDRCRYFVIGPDRFVQDETGMYGCCLKSSRIGVKAVAIGMDALLTPRAVVDGAVFVQASFGCIEFEEKLR